jgi:hypothetical protein
MVRQAVSSSADALRSASKNGRPVRIRRASQRQHEPESTSVSSQVWGGYALVPIPKFWNGLTNGCSGIVHRAFDATAPPDSREIPDFSGEISDRKEARCIPPLRTDRSGSGDRRSLRRTGETMPDPKGRSRLGTDWRMTDEGLHTPCDARLRAGHPSVHQPPTEFVSHDRPPVPMPGPNIITTACKPEHRRSGKELNISGVRCDVVTQAYRSFHN